MKKPKFIVVMEGGLVSQVLCSEDAEVCVIDYDIEGCDEDDEMGLIKQDDEENREVPAFHSLYTISASTSERIEEIFNSPIKTYKEIYPEEFE